ncbi:MAG TPA: host attachment protein [Steroidobacteraceae bacterium]|nr:host attachment protein [Steroidobacteraceae bacterium]
MRIRIVVANQAEAVFFDMESRGDEPRFTTRLSDSQAHLHDRDFKSDRPGRVFDHAPLAGGRRGATGHHGTGGERKPRKHEAELFAHRVAEQLLDAQSEFDRLVVIAAPAFLGLLRKALPRPVRSRVAAEVAKDLVNEAPAALRTHVPPDVFQEMLAAQ